MKIAKDGVIEKIAKNAVTEKWYVRVKISATVYQTYSGLDKRPKLCVGDEVKTGDEI
ncbi:MAG: hypothetical protein ACLRP9_01680 [Anaerovoracaceae bacterium]